MDELKSGTGAGGITSAGATSRLIQSAASAGASSGARSGASSLTGAASGAASGAPKAPGITAGPSTGTTPMPPSPAPASTPTQPGVIQRAASGLAAAARPGGALRGPVATGLSAVFAGAPVAINGIRSLSESETSLGRLEGAVRTGLGVSSFLPGAIGAVGRAGSVAMMGADIAGGIGKGIGRHLEGNAQRSQRAQQALAAIPSGATAGSPGGAQEAARGPLSTDRMAQLLAAIPGGSGSPAGEVPMPARELQGAGFDAGASAYQPPPTIAPMPAAPVGPITRAAQRAAMSPDGDAQVSRLQLLGGQAASVRPWVDGTFGERAAPAAGAGDPGMPDAVSIDQETRDARQAEARRAAVEAEERVRGEVVSSQELAAMNRARSRARLDRLLQAPDEESLLQRW